MLSTAEYRDLITSALPSATDADTTPPTPQTLFTPQQHRLALDPDVTIVLGGRGVGKTVWFEALQNDQLREIAAKQYQLPVLKKVTTIPGFGAHLRTEYPGPRVLGALVDDFAAEDIWTAVALHGLRVDGIKAIDSWFERVKWVVANPEPVEQAFIALDQESRINGHVKLILFDAMDRLHRDRGIADRLTGGALQFALNLRTSTRHLRAKIFIRHDMFESASTNFSDASKLANNKVDLRWDASSLYSLLFHLMSSHESSLADEFRQIAQWNTYKAGSKEQLSHALHLIASEYMGANHRKGYTYTWIPKHLQDGLGHTSPRSFLSAVSHAATNTREDHQDHSKALYWEAIRRGVQQASEIRVAEVKEDTPWVTDALDPLRGQQVPIEPDSVEALWHEAGLPERLEQQRQLSLESSNKSSSNEVRTGPVNTKTRDLVEDLMRLGIFTTRADGRLDLPDVYRIASGVGRKGGVPLARG